MFVIGDRDLLFSSFNESKCISKRITVYASMTVNQHYPVCFKLKTN